MLQQTGPFVYLNWSFAVVKYSVYCENDVFSVKELKLQDVNK